MDRSTVKQFLEINRQRLKRSVLIFTLVISVPFLLFALLARAEVPRPLSETLYAAGFLALIGFVGSLLAFSVDGITDFKKRRKVFSQANWRAIFEKYAFTPALHDVGGLHSIWEARQGRVGAYNVLAFVNVRDKAVHFVFMGRNSREGKAKFHHECNAHVCFTDLEKSPAEIEETLATYLAELEAAGFTPSGRTEYNFEKVK